MKDLLNPLWGSDNSKAKETTHCLSNVHQRKKATILIIYVNEIIVTRDDHEEIYNLKGKLAKEFKIKDLGSLRYFLGIEIA